MNFKSFREKFNLQIYENKDFTLKSLKTVSLLFSLGMLASMIYYYGYPIQEETKGIIIQWMKASFIFYIISYVVRFLYSFDIKEFLKSTLIEGVLYGIILMDGISYYLFDFPILENLFEKIGVNNFTNFYNIFLQLYLLIIVALDLGSSSAKFGKIKTNPAVLFVFIFLAIIMIGAGLLCLPEMTTISGSMNFLDALFTSTSATCVTGLIVEDTATFFTFKGHLILMMLIKIGGMNILAFGMFFTIISKFGIAVKQHDVIEDFVNKNSMNSAKGLMSKILMLSFFIEFAGAIGLFFTLPSSPEIQTIGDRLFHSIFHSVSAFNNAGIALYSNGFFEEALKESYMSHIILMGLIFLGALGFTTILELISKSEMRKRLKYPWKKLHISSQISIKSSIHLIIFGTVMFLLIEWNMPSLEGKGAFEKFITAMFQSVSYRTAGFNTVDTSLLSIPILMVFLLLMFIGGSSSSTAGGIKTSTFTLLMVSAWSTIRGKRHSELFNKSLSHSILEKAYSILIFALAGLLISVFFLTITEMDSLNNGSIRLIDLIFEEVSAFSTVGVSTGITAKLSSAGRVIIILSMFIGRIGTLTLAFALSKSILSRDYKYPDAHMMVG